MLVVFTVNLDVTRNNYAQEGIPPKIFMGLGYNGSLQRQEDWWPSRERLDLLQYFACMYALQQQGTEVTLWDASGFQIVNKFPDKKFRKLGENPQAEVILGALITEQDRPKRREIMDNCDERYQNLGRFCEVTGVDAQVLDSRKVWREDPQFASAFDVALEFVRRLQTDNPDLVSRIMPKNGNLGGSWYLPLEVAEAVYLQETSGITGKFGPKGEQYFDECILRLQDELEKPYTTLWCPEGPLRAGYLDEPTAILLCNRDRKYEVVLGFGSDTEYKSFVERYLEPFRVDGESPLECALWMRRELGGATSMAMTPMDEALSADAKYLGGSPK